MQTLVSFSDAAYVYIKKMIETKQGCGFRLSIKKTGCSGYAYAPAIIKDINPQDSHFKINEIDIYIDVTWLHLIKGLRVDYVEENKLGLKEKHLVFINPNESGRCGCGESFHAEK